VRTLALVSTLFVYGALLSAEPAKDKVGIDVTGVLPLNNNTTYAEIEIIGVGVDRQMNILMLPKNAIKGTIPQIIGTLRPTKQSQIVYIPQNQECYIWFEFKKRKYSSCDFVFKIENAMDENGSRIPYKREINVEF